MNDGRLWVVLVLMVTSSFTASAQLTVVSDANPTILKPVVTPSFLPDTVHLAVNMDSPNSKPSYLDLRQAFQSTTIQLPNYQVKDLAFFCRLEVRLESATRIPVRFRLGDVQYVDHLEGKIDGVLLGY